MYLADLFDDPAKRRAAHAADQHLKQRLDQIEVEIGNLHSELEKAARQHQQLEDLAKLAIGSVAEIVATHGQLPQRTEIDLAKRLVAAVLAAGVKMDPILQQNLQLLANRTIR